MIILDIVSLHHIAQHDFLIESIQPMTFVLIKKKFREASPFEVFRKELLHYIFLLAILPVLFERNAFGNQIFFERERKNLFVKVTGSQSCGDVTAQHLGIGTRDEYPI